MALDPNSRARFNLSQTVVLLLDGTPLGMTILGQIIAGLGARQIHRCRTVDEAKEVVGEFRLDLMIVDSIAEGGDGYEFVRWLRREVSEPNKHTPVLLTAGHTKTSDVDKARDCGAHFIVAKPIAPIVMLERIIWIAREGRSFLFSDEYVGPDRRFGKDASPHDHPRRRREDQTGPGEAEAS
ncbi:MAG TPA: response regulator [Caulobacteraceae bacterium]|nr:response regulator [Caulobacteraceae bacterium]